MLRKAPRRKFIYSTAEYVYLIAGALSSAVIWGMGLDGEEQWIAKSEFLIFLLGVFQFVAFYFLALFAVMVLLAMLIKQRADPWVVEKLQFILDEYQGKLFRNASAPYDHNRVTLFKFERGLWFKRHWDDRPRKWYRPFKTRRLYGDYLVPYMRSGHMALNTKTVFFVDSDNSANTEGVAGEAWAKRGVTIRPDLPVITSTTGKRDRESYATVTRTKAKFLEKYLNEGRQPPRSIVAMPVECNGNLWGVIVLDSLDPLGVTRDSAEHYTLTVALIGQLLERAK